MLANISFTEKFLHLNKKKTDILIKKKNKKHQSEQFKLLSKNHTLKKQIHVHDCSLSWLGTGT